jgi:hypothetical protein
MLYSNKSFGRRVVKVAEVFLYDCLQLEKQYVTYA